MPLSGGGFQPGGGMTHVSALDLLEPCDNIRLIPLPPPNECRVCVQAYASGSQGEIQFAGPPPHHLLEATHKLVWHEDRETLEIESKLDLRGHDAGLLINGIPLQLPRDILSGANILVHDSTNVPPTVTISAYPSGAHGDIQFARIGHPGLPSNRFAGDSRLRWDEDDHRLEVRGDINILDTPSYGNVAYRINGIPFAFLNPGGTDINLGNIGLINGMSPGSQWIDIPGGGIYYDGGDIWVYSGNAYISGANNDAFLSIGSSSSPGDSRIFIANEGRRWSIVNSNSFSAIPGSLSILDMTSGDYRLTVSPQGQIGIGKILPQVTLDVYSPLTDNSPIVYVGNPFSFLSLGGDFTGFWINSASFPLTFRTADVERMRIDSQGRVGIGTQAPQAALDVAGMIRSTGYIPPTTGRGAELFYLDGSGGYLGALDRDTNTPLPFFIRSSELLLNPLGGRVGIGILTTPQCLLDTGMSSAPIKISTWVDPNTGMGYGIGVGSETLTFGAGIDVASGVPQMVLTMAGRVGIGTQAPQAALDVGDIYNNHLKLNATTIQIDYTGSGAIPSITSSGQFEISATGVNITGNNSGFGGVNISSDYIVNITSGMFLAFSSPRISAPNLPSTDPGAGTQAFWYDPSDGNRVKFSP